MEILLLAVGVYLVWLVLKNMRQHQSLPISSKQESAEEHITEERVFESQTRFEKHLEDTFLPDAISGKEIYIYYKLIVPWYEELSGKHRYSDEMTQKLRADLLQYIWSVKDSSTCFFLYFEAEEGSDKAKEYEKDGIVARKKAAAIEDAFAAAVGPAAVKELARIRDMDVFRFDKNGNMAPDGQRYGYDGNLHPLEK